MIYFLHVNKQFRIEDVSSHLNVNCFLGLGPNKVCTGALELHKFLKLSLALMHLLLTCLRQKNYSETSTSNLIYLSASNHDNVLEWSSRNWLFIFLDPLTSDLFSLAYHTEGGNQKAAFIKRITRKENPTTRCWGLSPKDPALAFDSLHLNGILPIVIDDNHLIML